MYIFRTFKIIVLIIYQIIFQWIITQIYVKPILKRKQKKYSVKINKSLEKKIYYQYTIFVPSVLIQFYQLANNKNITIKERKYLTLLGSISPVFDDFFDDKLLEIEEIKKIIINYKNHEPKGFYEETFLEIYSEILNNLKNPELFIKHFLDMFYAQKESLKQINGNLADKELQKITFQKGAESYFLFLSFFGNKITENENNLYYKLGALYQLCNDGFDIYKDLINNIQTIANSSQNFEEYSKLYRNLLTETVLTIQESNFINNKKKCISIVLIFTTLTLVAHNQINILSKAKLNWNEKLNLKRNKIICDMAKWKNQKLYIHFALYYLKKHTK
ncbi:MAG: hypothetical protein EAZ27_06600 [Cytophagales bacterium]|nr:MAG: hypothetical protein EAZ27_06600 [Cytophagales bacterium]